MSLKNSRTNSCFSGIFDPSYPYENCPNKTKKVFWLQPGLQK